MTSHNFSWIMIVANPGSSLYLGTNKAMKRETKCIDLIGSGLFQDMSKLERMRVGRLLIIPLPASDNQPHLAFVMSGDNSYLGHMTFPILDTCDGPDGNPLGLPQQMHSLQRNLRHQVRSTVFIVTVISGSSRSRREKKRRKSDIRMFGPWILCC